MNKAYKNNVGAFARAPCVWSNVTDTKNPPRSCDTKYIGKEKLK